jgi:hypothetical protein
MGNVRIFMSFDLANDQDLHDLLLEQSSRLNAGFEISARSEHGTPEEPSDDRVRRRIREADEMIVICGKHTAVAPCVSAELRIAQEEQKPYFLLWGRRESMCTRPAGARPADAMYSWTWDILRGQILATNRAAQADRTARVVSGFAGVTPAAPAATPAPRRSPAR